MTPTKPRSTGLSTEERHRQIDALPTGTALTCIYPKHGWQVFVRRAGVLHNGGHYMDLSDAVKARDRLADKYPQGVYGRPWPSRNPATESSNEPVT